MELKNHQPPLNVEEQVKNLKEIGLVINDEEYAKSILNDISYFRLIKGYGLGLKERNSNFDGTVTIENIVQIYFFDANLRQLISVLIEKIEVNFRCRLCNYFCCKYGAIGYENPAYFKNLQYHNEFMEEINKVILRNCNSPFVKNFQNNYIDGKLPMYSLAEISSFGTLSKFFKNMLNADKKEFAKIYGVGYTYLESWIEHIVTVRNICAHYNRIYNFKIPNRPMLYSHDNVEPNKIFATLLCIKRLLPRDRHWIEFADTLEALFEKYSDVDKARIGFPQDWYNKLVNEK